VVYLFILFIIYYYLFSVNITPSRHRFGFSLAWDWQYQNYPGVTKEIYLHMFFSSALPHIFMQHRLLAVTNSSAYYLLPVPPNVCKP
jgi:hypothetical protein